MITVTPTQRQQLADDGYFITEVLFDTATLDGVQSEFDRMWREDIAKAEASGVAKDIELARLRPFFAFLERRSQICAAFCKHPQLRNLARQLINSDDLDVSWNQAIAKPPGKGKPFAWHQDAYYAVSGEHAKGANREEYLKLGWAITFWIAITRTTVANGTLWVVPGKHKQGLLPHVWSDEAREFQCDFDSTGKIPAELKRGQVLVFTNLTPHCSGANVSDEVRMAYQIGYAKPGMVKNNYQIPALRGGQPV